APRGLLGEQRRRPAPGARPPAAPSVAGRAGRAAGARGRRPPPPVPPGRGGAGAPRPGPGRLGGDHAPARPVARRARVRHRREVRRAGVESDGGRAARRSVPTAAERAEPRLAALLRGWVPRALLAGGRG